MRYFFAALFLIIAFFLERTVGMWFSVWYVPVPFVAAVTIFLFWRLNGAERLWLGGIVGFILDSISPLPFGVYMGAFFLLSALTHFLQFFFSNIASSFTKGVSMGILLLMFFFAVPPIAVIFEYAVGLANNQYFFAPHDLIIIGLGAIVWSLLFSILSFLFFECYGETV